MELSPLLQLLQLPLLPPLVVQVRLLRRRAHSTLS